MTDWLKALGRFGTSRTCVKCWGWVRGVGWAHPQRNFLCQCKLSFFRKVLFRYYRINSSFFKLHYFFKVWLTPDTRGRSAVKIVHELQCSSGNVVEQSPLYFSALANQRYVSCQTQSSAHLSDQFTTYLKRNCFICKPQWLGALPCLFIFFLLFSGEYLG